MKKLVTLLLLTCSTAYGSVITNVSTYVETFPEPTALTSVQLSFKSYRAKDEYVLEFTLDDSTVNPHYIDPSLFVGFDPGYTTTEVTTRLFKITKKGEQKLIGTDRYSYEFNIPEPAVITTVGIGCVLVFIVRHIKLMGSWHSA